MSASDSDNDDFISVDSQHQSNDGSYHDAGGSEASEDVESDSPENPENADITECM